MGKYINGADGKSSIVRRSKSYQFFYKPKPTRFYCHTGGISVNRLKGNFTPHKYFGYEETSA